MKNFDEIFSKQDSITIKNVKTDSRKIKKGDIFVATHGFNVDHSEFILDAIKRGASIIVSDKKCDFDCQVIKVDDIEDGLTEICKRVYNYDNEIDLIGITGTDGKTTTAEIIYQLLGETSSVAYIGTNGLKFNGKQKKLENTTPEKEKLYEIFAGLKKELCKSVVMEVSSEALLHNRVNSFLFKYAIFTNITGDHLNIHKTMDSYINSKLKLLNYLTDDGIIILNKDDKNCSKITSSNHKIYTYGKDKTSDFQIIDVRLGKNSSKFRIKHKDRLYTVKSPFPFEYNVYNLTAAFIVCYLENMNIKRTIKNIKKLKPIQGRCEYLDFSQKYKIILDYAHTENGIINLVENVKKFNQKIIVVTGSAGGREKEKRSKIGKYLLNNVDFVVFTMDDPRYESVDDIIDQMIGDETKKNYIRIQNRQEAIFYALDIAKDNYYVLIIGKGRDNYMAIGDEKVDYCDYDIISKYFNS